MDSTLLGVIIGSFLALAGSVISQFFALRKDKAHWKHQIESEDAVWRRNAQKAEKELLREIYQKSLLALSSLIAVDNDRDDSSTRKDERRKYISNVQEWTTMLQIRHSDAHLSNLLSRFIQDPDEYEAEKLYEHVLELSDREQGFFISEISIESKIIKDKADASPSMRHISYKIDEDFRKASLIEGLDIPQNFAFDIELDQISESQRRALANSFFTNYRTIPPSFHLSVPDYRDEWAAVNMMGKPWTAKLNPFESDAHAVLNAWEADFASELADANQRATKEKTD